MKRLLFLLAVLAIGACAPVPVQPEPLPTLTQTPVPTPVPTSTPTPRIIPCARVIAQSLHIRYQTDYHASIAGWFVQDTSLTVRNQNNPDWWLVNGRGIDINGRKTRITGYVRSEWIEVVECQNVQTQPKNQRR